MIAEAFDTIPVETLLAKHKLHTSTYEVDFRGVSLKIDPEVFNPSYTRVTNLLADNMEVRSGEEVLDMFTGSGIIALLSAQKALKVIGVDISPYAVECAKKNADRLGLSDKVTFHQGSLWTPLNGQKFDLITANPPLLPAIPESMLESAVADSLDMSVASNFISGIATHLKPSGRAYMAFSNACKVIWDNPLQRVTSIGKEHGLDTSVVAEVDAGYELYRIIRFNHEGESL